MKNNNNTLAIIAIVIALIALGLVVGSKFTGNAIFDLNKKIDVREKQTANFDLEGVRYSLTVTKISGNTASFTLNNRDTGKSVNYPNQQQSEGLPIWQRYDLYISSIVGKRATFVITEKQISSSNLNGVYSDCYTKGGSTTDWGSNLYSNNTKILTNSVTVECNPGEEALISDFTCNPHEWQQQIPVYVQGVSMGFDNIQNVSGRTLTCTGGESQGIMNIVCCKKP